MPPSVCTNECCGAGWLLALARTSFAAVPPESPPPPRTHCTHTHTSHSTGSHDRSLRRWQRGSEPFFVEEERERRLEGLFEADLEAGRSVGGGGTLLLGPQGATLVGGSGECAGAAAALGVCAGAAALTAAATSPTTPPTPPDAAGGDEGAAGGAASAPAGRRTAEVVSGADAIMDALDVAAHEASKMEEHAVAAAAARVRLHTYRHG